MAEKSGDVQMDDTNGDDGNGNEEALDSGSELTAVQSMENGKINGTPDAAMEIDGQEIEEKNLPNPMEMPKDLEDLDDVDSKSALEPDGTEEPVDLSMVKTETAVDDDNSSSQRRAGLRKNPPKNRRLGSSEFVKNRPRASTRPESSATTTNEPRKRGRKAKSDGKSKRAKVEEADTEPKEELDLADQTQPDQSENDVLPNGNGSEMGAMVEDGPAKDEDGNAEPTTGNHAETNGGLIPVKEEIPDDNAAYTPIKTRSGRQSKPGRAPTDSSAISAQPAAESPKKRPKRQRQSKKKEDESGIFQTAPQEKPAASVRNKTKSESFGPELASNPCAQGESESTPPPSAASAQSHSQSSAQASIPNSEAPPSEPSLYKVVVSNDDRQEPQKFAYVSGHKPEPEPDGVDESGSPSSTGNRSLPPHPHPCQLPLYEFKNLRDFICAMCDRHMHDTKPSYVVIRLPTCEDCAANRCYDVRISEKQENENE